MPWTCFRKRLTLKEKVGQGKKNEKINWNIMSMVKFWKLFDKGI